MIKRLIKAVLFLPVVVVTFLLIPVVLIWWITTGDTLRAPIEYLIIW